VPSFIPIRFEKTELWAFYEESRTKNKNKMIIDMGSVSDPKKVLIQEWSVASPGFGARTKRK